MKAVIGVEESGLAWEIGKHMKVSTTIWQRPLTSLAGTGAIAALHPAMAEFEWPWQYSFPPFFTLQVNADVRRTQLDAWCSLVTAWGKNCGVSQIDVTEASNLDVFRNPAISRALPPDGIQVVLDELVRRGNLEWMDKTKRRGYLLWRSPGEWGQQIYSWAQGSSRVNTVCTLYEINHGDETADQDFHNLDGDILLKALRSLEVAGKAEIIEFGDNQGVKFL